MRKIFIFLIIFPLSWCGFSQFQLTGTVQDSISHQPISNASVVIHPAGSTRILGYSITDKNGRFKIAIQKKVDSLTANISMLGYEKTEKTLPAKAQDMVIELSPKSVNLAEVFIRNPPIKQHGDTLIFDPSAFKSKKDRSIKDVLAKMPGIDIKASGEIYYQGKPINKFYVEGLDLMGGQYGMITNNLQADQVKSVQILEDHQPIKVLDSVAPSDQAAINLKLKNDVTLSGKVKVGAGATPGLWYGDLAPMLFIKKFQALATYQTNNTGERITKDFSRFSTMGFRYSGRRDSKKEWLNVASPSTPSFASSRWLDNESHAGGLNVLFKDKNDFEYKINTAYINRFTKRNGGEKTTYLLPQGDTLIQRKTIRHARDQSLDVTATITHNKETNFLKEKLRFSKEWDRARAHLFQNEHPNAQRLDAPYTNISNNFEVIFPLGKQLVTFDSDIGYNESPQDLMISPGVFADILSPDEPLNSVRQQVLHKRFFARHSLSLTKKFGKFSLNLKPGIDFSQQEFNSQLFRNETAETDPDFQNDMRWQKLSTYVNVGAFYKSDRLNLFLNLPFSFTGYKIEDRLNHHKETQHPFTLNPSLWGYYKFWDYWRVTASTGYNKSFGPIDDIYSGYLLSFYRSLNRHDVSLAETRSKRGSFGLQYRNPISSWFGRVHYSYSETKQDQINNLKTLPNGATVLQARPLDHKSITNAVKANISRLISPIRTTFKLGGSYAHTDSDILINDNLLKNTTSSWNGSLDLSGDFVSWLTVDYTASLGLSTTENPIQSKREIHTQSHQLGIYVYIGDNNTINLSGEYVKNKFSGRDKENFFGDFMYRYTLSGKKKIDFEFSIINLFNKKTYRNFSVGNYTQNESYYLLRPRQFLVTVRVPL